MHGEFTDVIVLGQIAAAVFSMTYGITEGTGAIYLSSHCCIHIWDNIQKIADFGDKSYLSGETLRIHINKY